MNDVITSNTPTLDLYKELVNVSRSVKARQALEANGMDWSELAKRHVAGDYGDIPIENVLRNDLALFQRQGQAKSVYRLPDGQLVVVVTTFNQPVTWVHMIDEEH